MLLELFATVIVLSASTPAPESIVCIESTHGVLVESEAHPAEIDITALLPSGDTLPVATCLSSNSCAKKVTFPSYGLYQFPTFVRYAFLEPGDTGPYIIGVNATVIVVFCGIFADGFEDGTTDQWSKTEKGG